MASAPGSDPTQLMESAPSAVTVIDGERYLYFCGTSYYGLHADPAIMAAGCEAWQTYGHSTATSRAGFGTSPLHLELEQTAARFFGTESAAYIPSGYLSNLAALKALYDSGEFDVAFIDEHAHYSAFDAARATGAPLHTVNHCSPDDLASKLKQFMKPGQIPIMISDGLFPVFGKIAPARELAEVLEPWQGLLWLDDAHPLGMLGPNGRGTYGHLGLGGERLLFGGTLAKALGGFGGIIPGSRKQVSEVLRGPVVCGASAAPPPLAAATLAAFNALTQNPQWREQLWANAVKLRNGIRGLGFEIEESHVPIAAFSLDDARSMAHVQQKMLQRGIAIQHTEYSGSDSKGVLRMVVFSNHTEEQIEHLIAQLRALL